MYMRLYASTLILSLVLGQSALASYKDDIGYALLFAELGTNTPTGIGITGTQVEASVSTNSPVYFPDVANAEFVGKIITDVTGSNTAASGHATLVGRYFYGFPLSVAYSNMTIDSYLADDWLNDGFLRSSPNLPRVETRRVQNHSWISYSTGPVAEDKVTRLDYAINRDGYTCAVGLNNGAGSAIPMFMGSGYHSISVGLSSGAHSKTPTVYAGAGRMKPELVAPSPENATSFATPQVSGAAALLLQAVDDMGTPDAGRPPNPQSHSHGRSDQAGISKLGPNPCSPD